MTAEGRETPAARSIARLHPIGIAVLVTLVVTVLSYAVPDDYAATAVGACFVFAVIQLVLRYDATTIRHFGLSFGGLVELGPVDAQRVLHDFAVALA